MNPFRWITEVAFLAFAAGVFLVCRVVITGGMATGLSLWRRLFAPWTALRLRDLGIIREEKSRRRTVLDWRRLLIPAAAFSMAIVVRDALLSPLVLLFGVAALAWVRFQASDVQRAKVNEDAELAVLQMRSLLTVDHSLLNCLNAMELPDGSMKSAVCEVASRLQMHQSPEHAALALKNFPGTVTARLAALIANSSRITDEVQMSLFQAVEVEAHRQKVIRSRMRQTLALVRGTIRLLQGVAAAATGFVLLTSDWRFFFLQDVQHRTLLTALLTCAVLASLYFEYEVHQLGSGEAF
ncbi:MAG TPA: hypothetical protein VFF68_08120 [Anaerolineaceae bacterium]|nr:hypothetical protein [Anaerolineaceae bacterium]